MNNIDYCSGICCPIKNRCVRYLLARKARGNKLYWWVDPEYRNGKCRHFMKKTEGGNENCG